MRGDVLYVVRTPLGRKSTSERENPNSCWIDRFIFRWIPYRHYGIDLGEGRIVHFHTDSILMLHKGTIRITSYEDFQKDGFIETDLLPVPVYHREEVAQRALGRLGSDFGGYRIKGNNCEHFAMWCATGIATSRQNLIRDAWIRTRRVPMAAKRKALSLLFSLSVHN